VIANKCTLGLQILEMFRQHWRDGLVVQKVLIRQFLAHRRHDRVERRPADKVQRVFNTDAESPYAELVPNVKQTGIFVDRFFHKLTYADLATKYDTSPTTARKIYHNGVKRVLELLQMMDAKPRAMEQYQKQIEERSGKLGKGQKWFLLNKLFGVMPHEIAEMEGMKSSSSVRQLIIRVSDQLRSGEIRLIDTTPEESAAAKQRLDVQREKRRNVMRKQG